MVVAFSGHSKIFHQEELADKLQCTVENLISEGANQFLLGGYGQFDRIAASCVAKAKRFHPQIESILVIPYLERKYDTALYDRTLYPGLEHVPKRFAISKRNQYMVDVTDVLVACVDHPWGGASKTLEYAKRKKKSLYLLKDSITP